MRQLMRRLKIGPRLTLSFVAIVLLMFLGTAVGLWQFSIVNVQAQHLHQIDIEVVAILRVHNNILTLEDELQRLVEAQNATRLAEETPKLRNDFIKDVEQAITILETSSLVTDRSITELSQLRAIRTSLPVQMDSMVELAAASNWLAVQLRLENQVQQIRQISQNLVNEIDDKVGEEQELALTNMERAQLQATIAIAVTGILTLFVAATLGFVVTRSIAFPLISLNSRARALARGQFDRRIKIDGNDELTDLSRVFNDTASQLANLYSHLEDMVRMRTNELQHRALQLETSVAVGQRITSILDLDILLGQVVELIKDRYKYYYVGVFLLDESGDYVVAKAGTGEAGQILRQERFRLKVKVNEEGIIGWVAKNCQPARVNDVSQDDRYMYLNAIPDTRSELALPLAMGKKVLGVLDIQSDQLAAFRSDDVPAMQSLADQVAIAIQNAFLYQSEKSRRQLAETLYDVGRALSRTLDLSEVLDLILKHLAEIVAYDRAAVLLKNDDELEVMAARGFPAKVQPLQLRVPIKKGDIFQEVYKTQEPLIIPDVLQRTDWQHIENLPQARSWLGVPLIRFDHVIGMLSLTREIPGAYDHDEAQLAATFAGQAAIALENARLYDKITRFTQQLEETVRERTQAVQVAYDQLERLDRTKSEFISVASHELRTPLTILRGYSKMLSNDPIIQDDAHRLELVSGIHSGAVRMHEIVNSMLDIAKIDSRALKLYPEPVSVPALIELVCQKFTDPLIERDQILRVGDMDNIPAIEADPEALEKVFYHLIVNAIKYTPDGGTITIIGRSHKNGQGDLPSEVVEVIVEDTGIGIDPQFHELIFTKFYQTGELAFHSTGKTKFKGAGPGLGLAIARGIVEAHRGRIWAESCGYDEENCPGSQFHVILPLHQGIGLEPDKKSLLH